MVAVMIPGPVGKIEGRYHKNPNPEAPLALILHPHPLHGGTMNNEVAFAMYQTFFMNGFTVLRFNFRGVGKSEGGFDNGEGELNDAAAALDWLQTENPYAHDSWIAGFSFGAWLTMQFTVQRSELRGFVVVSPPANIDDLNVLAPYSGSALMIQGDESVSVIKVVKELDAFLKGVYS